MRNVDKGQPSELRRWFSLIKLSTLTIFAVAANVGGLLPPVEARRIVGGLHDYTGHGGRPRGLFLSPRIGGNMK